MPTLNDFKAFRASVPAEIQEKGGQFLPYRSIGIQHQKTQTQASVFNNTKVIEV